MIYSFGRYELDTVKAELRKNAEPIAVEPRVLSLLILLAENQDRLVSKEEIVEKIWDGRAISDAAVSTSIRDARRAVGDSGANQAVIKTAHGLGFRWVASDTTKTAIQPTEASDRPSLSILPFAKLAQSNELDHLVDGLAEELIASLSTLRWLFVVAARSSRRYRDDDPDPRTVASDLNVRYLVQGSFMQVGANIRIIVKLIDGVSGVHIEVYRTTIFYSEIFSVIDILATQIAGKLLPGLTASEWQRVRRKPPSDLGAWELYLGAVNHLRSNTEVSCLEAKRLLTQAVSRAPDFAAAHAKLATCFIHEGYYGWGEASKQALIEQAFNYARHACAVDSNEALAYDALASAHQLGGDYDEAISLARKAIDMSPTCMAAYGTLATALAFLGRSEDAIFAFDRAVVVSPQDPDRSGCLMGIIVAHFIAGRYGESVAAAREHQVLRPNWYGSYLYLTAGSALLDKKAEAQAAAQRIQEIIPNFSIAMMRERSMLRRPEDIDHLARGLSLAGIPAN